MEETIDESVARSKSLSVLFRIRLMNSWLYIGVYIAIWYLANITYNLAFRSSWKGIANESNASLALQVSLFTGFLQGVFGYILCACV